MRRCEHCNSLCHVALVCGRCGKEHGPEFFKEAEIESKGRRIFWALMAIMVPVYVIMGNALPFEVSFLIGLILPLWCLSLAAFLSSRHSTKEITLKNGKTLKI